MPLSNGHFCKTQTETCNGKGTQGARRGTAVKQTRERPRPPRNASLRHRAMSCSVAIPSSPVFSPSLRPLSCKAASASPEPVAASVSSPAPAPAGSPLRPFALRALFRDEASSSVPQPVSAPAVASAPSVPVLKRRRPAPLVLPVGSGAAAAAAVAAVESDPRNEVEEEGEKFAAYCRRGKGRRRVEMEDRHVAKVALGGDPKVVSMCEALHFFWGIICIFCLKLRIDLSNSELMCKIQIVPCKFALTNTKF
jgi:hypothetical protein